MAAIFICGSLVGLILIGVPIAVALGVTAIGTYVVLGETAILTMFAQRMFSATTGFTLLAIPFFILAGNLMNTAGITDRMFRFAGALVGHMAGGLAQVNVIASFLFSSMSGSAVADAAGLGQVELKAMRDRGFDPRFAAAVTASSSTIAPIFPPSIPFVIYGSLTGVSVLDLFLAGIVPGILMASAMMIGVYFVASYRGYPVEERASRLEVWSSFKSAVLPLGMPVLILGGIHGGLFTPTEAAVSACIYALFLGAILYRELHLEALPAILWATLEQSIRVLFIIASAGFFGWLLVQKRVPDALIAGLMSVSTEPAVVLALLILVLLILGMILESIAVIVLAVPLLLPVALAIGVDPIQFGTIVVLCSVLGLITPPVGILLFAISAISGVSVPSLVREIWPYIIGILVVLILVACVPELSTWLPRVVRQ